jgi:hypothetical protein
VYVRWAPSLVKLERPHLGESVILVKSLEEVLAEDSEYQQDSQDANELERWVAKTHSSNRRDWKCARPPAAA